MGKKIAITGICSTLAQSILPVLFESIESNELNESEKNFSIRGIDIVKYSGPYESQIEMIQTDIRDKSALLDAFEGVDVVIHLAFIVVLNVPKNFEDIYDININGSKNVFECAAASNVKQIIYFSSVAAYGMSPRTPALIDENTSLEGHLMKNEFYYSYCKGMVENFLDGFEKVHPSLIITRFRPQVIAGPHFSRYSKTNMGLIAKIETNKSKVYSIQTLNAQNAQNSINRSKDVVQSSQSSLSNPFRPLTQLTYEEDLANLTLFAIQSQLHGSYNVAGEPLDFGAYLEERGKKIKYIPYKLVSILLSLLSPFSHKYRVLSQWLNGIKYQVIVSCEKLAKLNLPFELKSTQEILEEVVEIRKKDTIPINLVR
ncbi:MAG: NAD-dependent epimerase/dehydratase family protein [Promethearchaeota archaeon]